MTLRFIMFGLRFEWVEVTARMLREDSQRRRSGREIRSATESRAFAANCAMIIFFPRFFRSISLSIFRSAAPESMRRSAVSIYDLISDFCLSFTKFLHFKSEKGEANPVDCPFSLSLASLGRKNGFAATL